MKSTFWILSALTISLLGCVDAKPQTAPKNLTIAKDKCSKKKSFPVCGSNGTEYQLFGNECLLKEAGEKPGDFTKTSLKSCFKDCGMICLGYYDPVCVVNPATNATRTFDNKCEVIKDACQTEIEWIYKKQGKCTRKIKKPKSKNSSKNSLKKRKPKPIPCPKIFNPVCAVFNGVKSTFINECLANAENVNNDKDWRIFSTGVCEEDYKSVSSSKTPNEHEVKKRSLNAKDFGNLENAFDLGESVTYIRPPPVFQTHFIKNADSERIFNREENKLRTLYEEQLSTNSEYMQNSEKFLLHDFFTNANAARPLTPLLNQNHFHAPNQHETGEFYLNEMLKNLPYHEAEKFYYPDSSEMHIPVQTAFSSSDGSCKLGTVELCCSYRDKVRTFKNMCDLILHNESTREDWNVEHVGVCKNCNFMCPDVFEPLCISMNGLQYTIRNECILNAAICKNEARDWKIIKKGVCAKDVTNQSQNVKDKYAAAAPGFLFTSYYLKEATQTTEIMTTPTTKMPVKNAPLQSIQKIKQNKKKTKVKNPKPFQVQEPNGPENVQTDVREEHKITNNTMKGSEMATSSTTTNYEHTTIEVKQSRIEYTTVDAVDPSTTALNLQNEEHFSTTSKPNGADIIDDKMPLRQDNSAEDKRLSIYGPNEYSIMGALLQAIQGSFGMF